MHGARGPERRCTQQTGSAEHASGAGSVPGGDDGDEQRQRDHSGVARPSIVRQHRRAERRCGHERPPGCRGEQPCRHHGRDQRPCPHERRRRSCVTEHGAEPGDEQHGARRVAVGVVGPSRHGGGQCDGAAREQRPPGDAVHGLPVQERGRGAVRQRALVADPGEQEGRPHRHHRPHPEHGGVADAEHAVRAGRRRGHAEREQHRGAEHRHDQQEGVQARISAAAVLPRRCHRRRSRPQRRRHQQDRADRDEGHRTSWPLRSALERSGFAPEGRGRHRSQTMDSTAPPGGLTVPDGSALRLRAGWRRSGAPAASSPLRAGEGNLA
jgi:hypothetical protein